MTAWLRNSANGRDSNLRVALHSSEVIIPAWGRSAAVLRESGPWVQRCVQCQGENGQAIRR